jgi:hypothetical protein
MVLKPEADLARFRNCSTVSGTKSGILISGLLGISATLV